MFLLSPLCCRSRTGVWVIMVHYRQGTFHCYVLSCVVSGDKRTTILISVRRRNTWLEPMKSAFSFCHWLRPSGPNKVFPFESTAVRNFMETLLLCVSVNLRSLFKARRVCFMALSFLCQVWSVLTEGKNKTKQNTTSDLHLFLFSFAFSLCASFLERCPSCVADWGFGHISQSVREWQFYNTCTTLMGAITHRTTRAYTYT